VVLLCNILGRWYKISFVLATVVASKISQPPLDISVSCFEGNLLIYPLPINWNNEMLLLHQEVKYLPCSNSFSVHPTAGNKSRTLICIAVVLGIRLSLP
jgi:hypothetical protein